MRQAITTLVLLAVTVSAIGQLSPGACPMQATLTRTAHLESAVPPCHASHTPSSLGASQCVLTHSCCRVAPAYAQLLLSRWTLVTPATDSAVMPQSIATTSSEPLRDFQVYAEELGARPSVERLKTDLRI